MAVALGVTFRFGTSIDGLEKAGDRIVAVQTSGGRLTADTFVLALGS